ncbi:kinase A anchor protein [Colletotrichum cereale]|nr:kinase A anchor protein [Colletotrichum cereale]
MKPTHFLCIPLVTQASRYQLSESLGSFKTYVTDTLGIHGMAVRPLSTMHLTLGVMNLPKDEDLTNAIELLHSVKPMFPKKPLKISLHGLDTFPGTDIRHAHILFAHPTCLDYDFEALCHRIRAIFEDADLVDKTSFGLTLHATVINARKTPDKKGIDATELLERYADYLWMDSPIKEIGICRMGAQKKGDDGDEEYPLVASIDI